MDQMTAKRVYYEGHVQGVGFRYTTKQTAMGYEVTGWVKNLPDRRVEMLVVGEVPEVEDFLQDMRDGVLGGHIRREEVQDVAAPDGMRGFSIAC